LLRIPKIKHRHACEFSGAIAKSCLVELQRKPIVEFVFHANSKTEVQCKTVVLANACFEERSINVFSGMERNAHQLYANEPLGMHGEREKK
jgi:hypothetical protein